MATRLSCSSSWTLLVCSARNCTSSLFTQWPTITNYYNDCLLRLTPQCLAFSSLLLFTLYLITPCCSCHLHISCPLCTYLPLVVLVLIILFLYAIRHKSQQLDWCLAVGLAEIKRSQHFNDKALYMSNWEGGNTSKPVLAVQFNSLKEIGKATIHSQLHAITGDVLESMSMLRCFLLCSSHIRIIFSLFAICEFDLWATLHVESTWMSFSHTSINIKLWQLHVIYRYVTIVHTSFWSYETTLVNICAYWKVTQWQ